MNVLLPDNTSEPPIKRHKTESAKPKLVDSARWCPGNGVFVKVSRDGSKQTMFVLSPLNGASGVNDAAIIGAGAIFGNARVSKEAIQTEDSFGNANACGFSLLLEDMPACEGWTEMERDIAQFRDWLRNMPKFAMQTTMLPLLRKTQSAFDSASGKKAKDAVLDSINGMSSKNVAIMLKDIQDKSDDDAIEYLVDRVGGKGTNEATTIMNLKKKIYDEDVFDDEGTFRSKILDIRDRSFPYEDDAIARGDIAFVLFRAVFRVVANNMHVSYEPIQLSVKQAASAGGGKFSLKDFEEDDDAEQAQS